MDGSAAHEPAHPERTIEQGPGRRRDRAYEQLEELIIRHELPPGSRLTETNLAERLGVSRNPVREALHALHRQGWLTIGSRAAVVRTPTAEEIGDFFTVRSLLESEAVRLAAIAPPRQQAIGALRDIIEQADSATGSASMFTELNTRFHRIIHQMAGNTVLLELLENLDKRLRWYLEPISGDLSPDSWKEHQDMLDAIIDRDPDRAVHLIQSHCRRTTDVFSARLDPGAR